MADAPAFEWVCTELQRLTSFSRLEARGTVRLALKQAGFEARGVTPDQMKVVVERVLPEELRMRGVETASSICETLATGLGTLDASTTAAAETPEAVFRRLGSRA